VIGIARWPKAWYQKELQQNFLTTPTTIAMTHRTTTPLSFSTVNGRKLTAEFSAGHLTTDAGLLLLREADKQIGLTAATNAAIADPRVPERIVHPQQTILAQRIYALAQGHEDLNDHEHLRLEPLWQAATDHPEVDGSAELSSAPTLCRFENRITRHDLVRIAAVLVDQFVASFDTPPEELTLDIDATDDPIHGHQEQHFFHGYYDHDCFLPLYITCGSQLLVAYLRPSDIGADRHARAIIRLLVTRLCQSWPGVKILIRGDGGFCRWRLMRWCDKNDIRYIFGLPRNAVLERMSAEWLAQVRTAHEIDGQSHRVFGTISYAAESWDRPRRVIVKAEHLRGTEGGKSNPRYIVTNLGGDAQTMYEDVYCQRGDSENRIKEQQLGLFADRTSCHAFLANMFRVLLSALAYVLVEHIRRTALVGTELEKAEVGTIRKRLFRIAAWVVQSVRRWYVRLSRHYVWQDLFALVAHRLQSRRPPEFSSS
jgi:hypothetical protein